MLCSRGNGSPGRVSNTEAFHFGATCLLANLALARRSPLPALTLTMVIGTLVELEQAFTSRGGKVADLLPDLLGALCVIGLILAVRRLRRRPAAPDAAARQLAP
jgi:VanZ family protein